MNAHATDHERFEQLAVGHALAALEPADEQEFVAHLGSCDRCAHDLVDHLETLASLAHDAAPAEPPPSVLEGIRAGVAASGRGGALPAPSVVVPMRARRPDRTVRLTTALIGVAASVVLVMALLIANMGLSSREHDAREANQQLAAAVSQLLVSGAHRVDLSGTGDTKAVAVVKGDTVSLVLAGVPVNDRHTSIYVLWEQSRFGDVRAVGAFDVSSSSLAVVKDLHLGGTPLKALMVTKEPGRKAPLATAQKPILAGAAA